MGLGARVGLASGRAQSVSRLILQDGEEVLAPLTEQAVRSPAQRQPGAPQGLLLSQQGEQFSHQDLGVGEGQGLSGAWRTWGGPNLGQEPRRHTPVPTPPPKVPARSHVPSPPPSLVDLGG